MKIWAAGIITIVFIVGCREGDPGSVVRSTPRLALRVTDRVALQQNESDPIGRVADMVALGDTILLVDIMQANIKVFDWSGRALGAWGGPGDGPGEFRYPAAIAALGDTLAVLDRVTGRVSLLNREGQYFGAWTAPGAFGPDLAPLQLQRGPAIAIATKIGGRNSGENAVVHEVAILDQNGVATAMIGELPAPVSPVQRSFRSVYLASVGNHIVLGSMDSDEIHAVDIAETNSASVHAGGNAYHGIDWQRAPGTHSDIWQWLAGYELLTELIPIGSNQVLVRFRVVGDTEKYRYVLVDLPGAGIAHVVGSTDVTAIAVECWDGQALWGYQWQDDGKIDLVRLELPATGSAATSAKTRRIE